MYWHKTVRDVLALTQSDDYFRAIRRELQEALREGVILIERQQVTLL
jgi:hypothetical protein